MSQAQAETLVPPRRRSKEISLEEAGRIIASKKVLHTSNAPVALLREAIRAGAKELTIIPQVNGGYIIDLLIAAGCVETLYVSYVGLEVFGFAPAFRRAAERHQIKIIEADEPFLIYGARAAAGGLPFIPVDQVYEATDLPKLNPLLKRFDDPFSGKPLYAIPPLPGDVCLVHAQECDEYGNAQIWAGNQQEVDKAMASEFVIVSTERIVSVDRTQERAEAVTLPGHLVHAVVHAPFGAHPTVSTRNYAGDDEHIREYLRAYESGTIDAYLARYVHEPKSHAEYVERVGIGRLMNLMRNI